MRLNICVDIDGTITDPYHWLKDVNEYFKSSLKAEDIVKFDICRILNITEEDYGKFYELHGERIHDDCILREGAREVLYEISKLNNIYYITARPEKHKEVTEKWIIKKDLPNAPLFMMGSHDKVDKAKELKCDLFLEDRYRNSVLLAKAGIKVLMMDTNYNRYALVNGITRVHSWNEIYKNI